MKKTFLLVLLLASYLANAQTISNLDQSYGFNTLHFEDNIANQPTLTAFDKTLDSQFVFYRKKDELQLIAGVNLDIVYTFFKGELSTVLLQTNDSISSRKVLRYLQGLYGKGVQKNEYIEHYMWYGQRVLLSYNEDINTFRTRVFISSIKMKLKYEGRDK